ncbi:MAG: hypothetical protein V4682_00890 [Patescibacteria group bacterium]
MEKDITMEKFEAKLCGYNALAVHMATLGLQHILGGIPIWSNIDVKVDDALSNEDSKVVHLLGNRIHVPGTRHLYKPAVQVTMTKTEGGHWKFRGMTIFLHHHRIDEYISDHSVDISLEPGVENITDFSSLQSEVDNPRLSYSVCLPALTSHFIIPE